MSYFTYKPVLGNDYYYGKPLVIDHGPQLLAGDTIVEDTYRVFHEQQTPVRYENNPIMSADAPWETGGIFRPSVIFDDTDGKYKMWYSTSHIEDSEADPSLSPLERGSLPGMICYAESKNGIDWVRPEVGVYSFGKWGRKNNIVLIPRGNGVEIGRVILNPDKTDLDRRFIIIMGEGNGLRIAFSKDGLRWTDLDKYPLISVPMDCSLNFAYDESRKVWQLFTRPTSFAKDESQPPEKDYYPNANYRRRVALTESYDLVSWSAPRIVFHTPENLTRTEADNINFFTVGSNPVAFIHCFAANNLDGCTYQRILPYLALGRDARHLKLLTENKPVIEYGRMPSYDDQRIIIDSQPHDLAGDGRSYFYYRGYHHDIGGDVEITFNLLSFDGNRYCARVADEYGGWLLTKEFILDGSSIEIDADIPDERNGEIAVEILDACDGHWRGGKTFAGFKLAECELLHGDSKHHILRWNGSSDVSSLSGKAVYLRFHIVNSRLYSFTVNKS